MEWGAQWLSWLNTFATVSHSSIRKLPEIGLVVQLWQYMFFFPPKEVVGEIKKVDFAPGVSRANAKTLANWLFDCLFSTLPACQYKRQAQSENLALRIIPAKPWLWQMHFWSLIAAIFVAYMCLHRHGRVRDMYKWMLKAPRIDSQVGLSMVCWVSSCWIWSFWGSRLARGTGNEHCRVWTCHSPFWMFQGPSCNSSFPTTPVRKGIWKDILLASEKDLRCAGWMHWPFM